MWRLKISFVLGILHLDLLLGYQTCSDCFQNLGFEWCTKTSDLNTSIYTRCLMNKNDMSEWISWCGEGNVYRPPNVVKLLENEPFTNPEDAGNSQKIIQIKPQLVEMKLVPGQVETLDLTFKYVKGYALELYYLMDMSKSMKQDKETIVQLADDLANELKNLTSDLKFGFGSFLDKVMLPYVNTHTSWLENPCNDVNDDSCRTPYSYQNIISLTNNTKEFTKSVENAKFSTNWDDPEGGLDGLMQAMVCNDIGWHTSTTRHLIVYVSGSAFKYAGDGKLAGLTLQNDMECHLDENGIYDYWNILDYPSVSQIEHVSRDKRMNVIFAVKKDVLPLYQALSKLIVQSEASELSEDSSNIIDIITTIYKDISRTLTLTDDSYNYPGLKVTYSSKCGAQEEWRENSRQCEDVDINEEIKFQVKFQLLQCSEEGEYSEIHISPQGLEDELIARVASNCVCGCEDDTNSIANAEQCTFQGRFACGICICNDGYFGESCECKGDAESSLDTVTSDKCKRPDDQSGRDCSGHGVCKCNKCECKKGVNGNVNWLYQGNFCECSNFDCPKTAGFLCSNHGRCECSKCICNEDWKGSSCSCDLRLNNCMSSSSSKVCSGHGDCICNRCQCHSLENDKTKRYFGKFCEDCETCEGHCTLYNECIRCSRDQSEGTRDNCKNKECSHLEIIIVDKIQEKENYKKCSYKNEEGCLVISSYNPNIENVVYVQKTPSCTEKLSIYLVIGIIVVIIVVIGILLLIIWKCWVTIKDKREYNKFIREYELASHTQHMNPIYRDPVTRVTNPLRAEES